jgi:dihydrofolate reductase
VASLKQQPGPDIGILGSGELIRSLRRRNLIDEYVLLIHPLVLGSGRRRFLTAARRPDLRLVDSVATTTGVMIVTHQLA